MANSRVQRGRQTEEAVAAYFRANGFPMAERIAANLPGADLQGVPSLAVEIKATASFDPLAWLRQAEQETRHGLPICISRRNGQGTSDPGEYVAILRLRELVNLLRDAGYGDPRETSPGSHPGGDLAASQPVDVSALADALAARLTGYEVRLPFDAPPPPQTCPSTTSAGLRCGRTPGHDGKHVAIFEGMEVYW